MYTLSKVLSFVWNHVEMETSFSPMVVFNFIISLNIVDILGLNNGVFSTESFSKRKKVLWMFFKKINFLLILHSLTDVCFIFQSDCIVRASFQISACFVRWWWGLYYQIKQGENLSLVILHNPKTEIEQRKRVLVMRKLKKQKWL